MDQQQQKYASVQHKRHHRPPTVFPLTHCEARFLVVCAGLCTFFLLLLTIIAIAGAIGGHGVYVSISSTMDKHDLQQRLLRGLDVVEDAGTNPLAWVHNRSSSALQHLADFGMAKAEWMQQRQFLERSDKLLDASAQLITKLGAFLGKGGGPIAPADSPP